jgi:hypothetical protein
MKPPTTTKEAYIHSAMLAIVTPNEEASIDATIWSEIYLSQLTLRELKAADKEIDRQAEAFFGRRPV